MKLLKFALLAFIIVISNSCQSTPKEMEQKTVEELDLDRYLGTWYEIARFNHSFERGLEGVTATYSIKDDGKIKVINKGYKNSLDGEPKVAIGKAKLTDEPGRLKVSFFWIFYADYLVMELDKDYQWVLIGSKSDKYLWILSRTPQLEESVKGHILNLAQNRGYDTSKLIWVEQKAVD